MIYYVLVPIADITAELERMQSAEIKVKETVTYEFTDGTYGVLMFDEVPEGYIGMGETEAREYISTNAKQELLL
jgi:hypothetical protein